MVVQALPLLAAQMQKFCCPQRRKKRCGKIFQSWCQHAVLFMVGKRSYSSPHASRADMASPEALPGLMC